MKLDASGEGAARREDRGDGSTSATRQGSRSPARSRSGWSTRRCWRSARSSASIRCPTSSSRSSSHLTPARHAQPGVRRLPFAEDPGGDRAATARASLLDRATVRKNFKPVPYFNPGDQVGADGTAKVKVKLPDNLTIFKIRAKAVSGADRFGFADGPDRRAPAGDRAAGAAALRAPGRPASSPGGHRPHHRRRGRRRARRDEGARAGARRPRPRRRSTGPDRAASASTFPVTVPTPPYTADGTLAATSVNVTLGVERSVRQGAATPSRSTLPIRPDRRPIVVPRCWPISAPAQAADRSGPRRAGAAGHDPPHVLVSDQPALVRMAAGARYLQSSIRMAAPSSGSATPAPSWRCSGSATCSIARRRRRRIDARRRRHARLDRRRRSTHDGLVAYLAGLARLRLAHRLGGAVPGRGQAMPAYAVDAKLLATLTGSLERSLRSRLRPASSPARRVTERVWALPALAAAAGSSPPTPPSCRARREFLNLESVAEVLQSFALGARRRLAGDRSALAAQIWDGVVLRLYQGREIYGGLQSRRRRDTGPHPAERDAHRRRGCARASRPSRRRARSRSSWSTRWSPSAAATAGAPPTPTPRRCSRSSELLSRRSRRSTPQTVHVKLGGEARRRSRSAAANPVRLVDPAPPSGARTVAAGRLGRPTAGRAGRDQLRAGRPTAAQVAAQAEGFVVSARGAAVVRRRRAARAHAARHEPGKTLALAVGDVIEEHVRVVNPEGPQLRRHRGAARRRHGAAQPGARDGAARGHARAAAHPRADLRRLPRRPGRLLLQHAARRAPTISTSAPARDHRGTFIQPAA